MSDLDPELEPKLQCGAGFCKRFRLHNIELGVTVNVVVTGELSCTAAGFTVVRFRLGTPACRPRLSPIFVIPVLLSEGSGA
jgi:hypothetical protein